MGLDMYLYASVYKSWSSWRGEEQIINYPQELKKLEEMNKKQNFLSVESKYQVGYWRKFNALHNYIVCHFAYGEDNCQEIYLSGEMLEQILNVCKVVLEDLKTCPKTQKEINCGWSNGKPIFETIEVFESEKALKLLPPSTGCFFGSQNIDQWYKQDLEYTVELLEECLKVDESRIEFYYQASW